MAAPNQSEWLPWYRVVAAVVVTAAFMVLQWVFWDVFRPFVGALSYPALLASVLIGGLWGGILSTAVATVAIAYVFMAPELTWSIENPNNIVALVVFVILGLSFSVLDHLRRRAMSRLADLRAEEKYLRDTSERLESALSSTIDVLARVVEARDPYTAGHQRRVGLLAALIARDMDLSASDVRDIEMAGLIHDIGKIAVPVDVLTKPGPLSEIEMRFAREHAQAGYDMLADAEIPEEVVRYVHEHHERCDGSGYPRGLTAETISTGGKILAVADVVEAMTSHRTYRIASTVEEAIDELLAGSGMVYDATVVHSCIRLLKSGTYQSPDAARQ